MTASPMNFSTTPPKDSISARTRSWYGVRIPRTSSGSRRSARVVKPTRSTKMTLTNRRSSCGEPASACSSEPQARQKRAISGFSCRQRGQRRTSKHYDGAPLSDLRSLGRSRAEPQLGRRVERLDDLSELLAQLVVDQVPFGVEPLVRMPERHLPVDDACAGRREDLPQLGLRPDGAECARRCTDDADRLVAQDVRGDRL